MIQSGYFGLRDNDAWIDEIIERLDLTDKAHANMRQLSGGMKRRVLVAQALVHKPPVIILDEPTAGVDVELRQGLVAVRARAEQAGHTIVLTTHYLEEAEALCSRIAMLKQGRVVALDTTRNSASRCRRCALAAAVVTRSDPPRGAARRMRQSLASDMNGRQSDRCLGAGSAAATRSRCVPRRSCVPADMFEVRGDWKS